MNNTCKHHTLEVSGTNDIAIHCETCQQAYVIKIYLPGFLRFLDKQDLSGLKEAFNMFIMSNEVTVYDFSDLADKI